MATTPSKPDRSVVIIGNAVSSLTEPIGLATNSHERQPMEKPIIALTPEAEPKGGRIGTIEATYDYLVGVLGEPHFTAGDFMDGKVTAEWVLTIQTGEYAGEVVSIYDYKLYDYDLGVDNISDYPEVFDFSLGGSTSELEPIIYNFLGIK